MLKALSHVAVIAFSLSLAGTIGFIEGSGRWKSHPPVKELLESHWMRVDVVSLQWEGGILYANLESPDSEDCHYGRVYLTSYVNGTYLLKLPLRLEVRHEVWHFPGQAIRWHAWPNLADAVREAVQIARILKEKPRS